MQGELVRLGTTPVLFHSNIGFLPAGRFVAPTAFGRGYRNKRAISQREIHARAAIIREIRDNKKGDWSPARFRRFKLRNGRGPSVARARAHIRRDDRNKKRKKTEKKTRPGIASIRRASVAPCTPFRPVNSPIQCRTRALT